MVVSKLLIYQRRISYEKGNQVPSNTVDISLTVSPSPTPSPLSVASIPFPSISSPVANTGNVSVSQLLEKPMTHPSQAAYCAEPGSNSFWRYSGDPDFFVMNRTHD